jgi:short-subunit dehydrogenase
MSFPMPGATLTLDFPNRGASTRKILARLEQITVAAGGRLYAAKDAVMTQASFAAGYPRAEMFLAQADPGFCSAFARRVGLVQIPRAGIAAMPDSRIVAIFGATSDIAAAVARRCAEAGDSLVLVGRNEAGLVAQAADAATRGAAAVNVRLADFADLAALPAVAAAAWDVFGRIDVALIAYGTPADQAAAEQEAKAAAAVLRVNFESPVLLIGELSRRFEARGRGTIAAISSVAGDRGRRSNHFYGAAKAGLQTYLEGLRHRLHAAGVTVLDIRPGFVASKMTAHQKQSGPLWATPDRVAGDIVAAIGRRRAVLYTPWFWRLVMAVVRALPRPLFHRTSL